MADRIAVLHLTSSRGFYGIDRVIVTLGKYIDQRSFEFRIANIEKKTKSSSALVTAAKGAGVSALMVPCRGRLDWHAVKMLVTLVRDQKVQVIHSHEPKSRIYGIVVSKLTGVPVVTTLHVWTQRGWKSRIAEFVDIASFHLCNEIIAVSRPAAASMRRALISPSRVRTITNGIDLEEFKRASAQPLSRALLGIPPGLPVIGTVGRLEMEKGNDILLKAAQTIADKGIDAAFLMVGEGREFDNLREMAKSLGLADRVFFAGYQKDVRPFLAMIDIFVLPSRAEGTPMALLEAMLLGVPVVVTPVGGIPDVVTDHVHGILLREGTSTELAEAVMSLLADRTAARDLAERGRKRVEADYSARRMAEQYEDLYRQCAM